MPARVAPSDHRSCRARAALAARLLVALSSLASSGCGGAAGAGTTQAASPASVASSASARDAIARAGDPPAPEDAAEAPHVPRAGDSLAVLDDSRPRGELPRERIEAGIGRGKPAMGACLARAAEEGVGAEARLVATFIIEPSGTVESAAFLVSTLTDDALSECLLDAIRAIRFDPPRGGIVMVSYPFHFRIEGG